MSARRARAPGLIGSALVGAALLGRALVGAALVGAALVGGMTSEAMAEPAVPEAPAAAAGADAGVEAELVRLIKRAEREGFEQHDATRYFEPFAADAVWVEGRREVADAHDVRVDRKQKTAMLERRYRANLTGKEQLFLRDVESEITGDRAVVTASVRRAFFGGQDTLRRRYTLRRAGEGWQITEVRSWPVQEAMQGLVAIYDDGRWLDLDERADKALANESETLVSRATDLIKARRIAQAYTLARAETEKHPSDAEAWRVRADTAFELGKVDEAITASKRSQQLSPGEPVPLHLR